jgi:ribose transport system ATP-binding protein
MTTLAVTNISKTFATQTVLKNVDLSIDRGEVRGLIGQNGSGKSTLIKILAGYHNPDEGGEIRVDGERLAESSPAASDAAGLRFVHQDLGLVAALNTVENLALGPGFTHRRAGLINWAQERRSAAEALARLGHDIDVSLPVGELPMASRTAVAVARALSPRNGDARVLVLDEPTATLPAIEVQRLFELVRRVSEAGVSVVFVSHRLDEVVENCSKTTVLRDGALVATTDMQGVKESDLVELMIGQQMDSYDRPVVREHELGAPAIEIDHLSARTIDDVSITVSAGEVVGIAGITGSGREEFAPAVFGGVGRDGSIEVNGRVVPRLRPDLSIKAGLGLVPAERHTNAIFPTADVRENLSIVNLPSLTKRGLLRVQDELREVSTWLAKLDVRPQEPGRMIATLSGGNQQKVVIARWLRQNPAVLILDEPTQGVDVCAKADIHALVDEAASVGTAVIVASTESEELARLCDRVLVLRSGRIAVELTGSQVTTERITAATLDSKFSDTAASAAPDQPSLI